MMAPAQKFFHILPEERGKVLHFALFAGLLQAGVAIGMTAADSLFLSHLGADRLPIVYLCMPVVMAVYAPVYSFLLARLGIDRLVQLTLAAITVGGIGFGIASGMFGENTAWLLYFGKFYAGMWFIALYTLFWNFTDGYFSIRDGKRLYGVVAAGGSLGGIIGATSVASLTHLIAPTQLYFAWSVCAVLTLPLYARLRRRYRTIESDDHEEGEPATPREVLRVVFKTFRESRFALGVTVLCFAAACLTGMLEFLSMGVLSEGRTTASLAGTLGELQAIAHVLTLLINLVLFGRLVSWLGVANTALILPLCYAIAFFLLHLHAGPVAAIAAFYAYQSVLPGIEYNNINLLFNGVPARVKPLLRTFVEAMAEPLATAFAGLFLFSLAARLGRENVALAGLLAACGALTIALLVRLDYVTALANNLRRDWLNFADSKRDWSGAMTDADRALLRHKARDGHRAEQRVAADLLWRARDPGARPALLHLLSTASPGEISHLRPSIHFLLQADDPESRATTRRWLDSADGPSEPEVLDEFTAAALIPPRRVQAWQQSRTASEGTVAPVAEWHDAQPTHTPEMLAMVQEMFEGTARERSWAIRAIGDFRDPRLVDGILGFLSDKYAAVRTETLRTLGKLATAEQRGVVARVLPLLREGNGEQRHLILRLVARLGGQGSISELLRASEAFTSAESRELETMIMDFGAGTLPELIQVLQDPLLPHPPRSVAARALSRLDMPKLLLVVRELIEPELVQAHRHVAAFRSIGAGTEPGEPLAVLSRFYQDSAIESLEFVLELLSRIGRLPDYDLIRASLSSNPKDRANAIETIQQSCPRPIFERILFIIEQTQPPDPARLPAATASIDAILRRAADSAFPIERAAARAALRLDTISSGETRAVERVSALLKTAFFGNARVRTLDYLGQRATERRVSAGEVIYERGTCVDGSLYIVASGIVEIDRPGRNTTATAGAVFGERALTIDPHRSDRAVSQGATLLELPAEVVTRAVEIFPTLGISLYRFKTISAVQ